MAKRAFVSKSDVSAAVAAGTTVASSEETITDNFRNQPNRAADTMAAAVSYLKSTLNRVWVSRRRLRSMSLRLIREGVTFS